MLEQGLYLMAPYTRHSVCCMGPTLTHYPCSSGTWNLKDGFNLKFDSVVIFTCIQSIRPDGLEHIVDFPSVWSLMIP